MIFRFPRKLTLSLIASLSVSLAVAQNTDIGEIHGNFDIRAQIYEPAPEIDAPDVPEKLLFNGFGNLNYTRGKFSAGMRFESYQNVLLGFSPDYVGNGIPYRYVQYNDGNLDITLGNFYEQFGNGQILRSYFEPALGIDNSIDGARIRYKMKGIYLKGVIGQQRWYFNKGAGIVRGIDAEFLMNDILPESILPSKTRLSFGLSGVSKYQADDNTNFTLPENVMAYGGRFFIKRSALSLRGEYTYKINDPSQDNGFIYKDGQMAQLTAAYSKKGIGITFSAHTVDNMFFRSDRNNSSIFQDLFINYIPALTKQHTYNLMATLYPYATQPAGELALQGEVVYKAKKGTWLGGKYGTTFNVNYSYACAPDTTSLNDLDGKRLGYKTDLFSPLRDANGRVHQYFGDFNIDISKKLTKKDKIHLVYQNLLYDKELLEGKPGEDKVAAHIGVVDYLHQINDKHSIRTEAQGLFTDQDQGNWATVLIEYTYSPHWFFSVMDQYNYGNSDSSKRLHYPYVSVGYIKDASRVTISYGRQRAGIFCVGGVCRVVPASSGLTLAITTSF
jgi:hypothetical protein